MGTGDDLMPKRLKMASIRHKNLELSFLTGGQALTAISLCSTYKNNRLKNLRRKKQKIFTTAIIADSGGNVNG